ncbi:hypothetical protein B0I37DRAFT_424971 [Chaetomium sp. MPI-CAGE-AT-0009]|nr:hypothetical protein B0I37DRAFT_424971 [Chaetomium sp. MPI-CAGE-AT-0009]
MSPSTTTGPAVPTKISTPTPAPALASSTSTTNTSIPSQPVDATPNSNNPWASALNNNNNTQTNTTVPPLTVTPAIPSPEVTAHLVKQGTNADAAPTMGHKSRKAVLYVTSFFVPPLAVYLRRGTNKKHFGLNVLLTLLGWIPGVLHAMYLVSK